MGTDRDLGTPVTALTYQALATFDPDAEVDEEGHQAGTAAAAANGDRNGLLDRLHDNGRALVAALQAAGPLTLVLDECHHLLELWGRLLAEVLEELPDAYVIGLTATPPGTLTGEQAALVEELCEAERFAELRTDLLDPDFATVSFLDWLDARFVRRAGVPGGDGAAPLAVSWARLEKDDPELAAAALRFVHAGLLALPDGARVREELPAPRPRRTPQWRSWPRSWPIWGRTSARWC